MSYAAGNIVDFVRGFGQRKKQAKFEDAMKNYLTKPKEALMEASQIDPIQTMAAEEKIDAKDSRNQKEYYQAILNGASMLQNARDKGMDVGQTYQSLRPLWKNGLGMDDTEIDMWGQQIAQNPGIIDAITKKAADELKVGTPGSVLWDDQGNIISRNPALPSVVTVKDGQSEAVVTVPRGPQDSGGGRGAGGPPPIVSSGGGSAPSVGAVQPVDLPPSAATQAGGTTTASGFAPKQIDPQARGIRNNNFGNLEASAWVKRQPGYVGTDGRFAKFETPEAGQAAMTALITNKLKNGQNTPESLIATERTGWAPRSDNPNVDAYVQYVSGRLGIGPNDPFPPNSEAMIAAAISEFENGKGGGGGGSSSAAPAAAAQAGGAEVVFRGAPKATWRMLSSEEVKENNLNPNNAYQISPEGQIDVLDKQTSGRKVADPVQIQSYTSSLEDLAREANGLLNHPSFAQATGTIEGMLPSIRQGSVDFDTKLQAFKDKVVLNTISAMKTLSATGATGFGNLTEKEGSRLENARGSLNPRSPENLKKTFQEIIEWSADNIAFAKFQGSVPIEHIRALRKNPDKAADFDRKYGPNTAQRILGGQ